MPPRLLCGFVVLGLVGSPETGWLGLLEGCLAQPVWAIADSPEEGKVLVTLLGVSALGGLGGRLGVTGSRGEAVGALWTPVASPKSMSTMRERYRRFVLG